MVIKSNLYNDHIFGRSKKAFNFEIIEIDLANMLECHSRNAMKATVLHRVQEYKICVRKTKE